MLYNHSLLSLEARQQGEKVKNGPKANDPDGVTNKWTSM